MSGTINTEADEAAQIKRALADLHHEAVHLVGVIKGIGHLTLFALRDSDTAAAASIEHAVEAARDSGQNLVTELEYLSGISTRPV